MKRILLIVAITLQWGICQENKSEPLHRMVDGVRITALSIQQDASPSDNPHLPVVYLKGNVEIVKPSCVTMSSGRTCFTKMVLRADEAEYHPDTGEIKPSGNVRITFEELK